MEEREADRALQLGVALDTTSASRQRRAHASRCSRSSRSKPACFASPRAAWATLRLAVVRAQALEGAAAAAVVQGGPATAERRARPRLIVARSAWARSATVPGRASEEKRSDACPSSRRSPAARSRRRVISEPSAGSAGGASSRGTRQSRTKTLRRYKRRRARRPGAAEGWSKTGAPRVPSLPSASVSSDSCTRSSSGSSAVDRDRPFRVAVELGHVPALPTLQLVGEHAREEGGAAADGMHVLRRAAWLGADRDDGRPQRSGHEEERIASRKAAEQSELVTRDQHEPLRRCRDAESSANDPVGRVALVGETDLDVLRIARHPRICQPSLVCTRRPRARPPPEAGQARRLEVGP